MVVEFLWRKRSCGGGPVEEEALWLDEDELRPHRLQMKKCEHLEPRGQRHTCPAQALWPRPLGLRSLWLRPGQQNFSRLH